MQCMPLNHIEDSSMKNIKAMHINNVCVQLQRIASVWGLIHHQDLNQSGNSHSGETNVFSPEWEVPDWHPYTCIFKPCPRDNVDLRIHSTHLNCSLYSKQEPTCNTIDSKCSSCKETWYVSNIRPADQKPLTRRPSWQTDVTPRVFTVRAESNRPWTRPVFYLSSQIVSAKGFNQWKKM